MATKPNMYAGSGKDINEVTNAINNCIMMSYYQEDGTKDAAVYDMHKATSIRDYVLITTGKLQVWINGLDAGSKVKAKYEKALNLSNTFLNDTKTQPCEPYERS